MEISWVAAGIVSKDSPDHRLFPWSRIGCFPRFFTPVCRTELGSVKLHGWRNSRLIGQFPQHRIAVPWLEVGAADTRAPPCRSPRKARLWHLVACELRAALRAMRILASITQECRTPAANPAAGIPAAKFTCPRRDAPGDIKSRVRVPHPARNCGGRSSPRSAVSPIPPAR